MKTELPGVFILEPDVFGDSRGFFREVYHAKKFSDAGIADVGPDGNRFVQLNHSRSIHGTLRGLHFQEPHAQGKLVWVVSGSVLDVAVDVRIESPAFGRWTAVELSEDNHRLVWVPAGFAHGFCVRSAWADLMYACTAAYAPDCEQVVRWNDPEIGIEWPVADPILSAKDENAPLLAEAPTLPRYEPLSQDS